jgi:hypothetical protein
VEVRRGMKKVFIFIGFVGFSFASEEEVKLPGRKQLRFKCEICIEGN